MPPRDQAPTPRFTRLGLVASSAGIDATAASLQVDRDLTVRSVADHLTPQQWTNTLPGQNACVSAPAMVGMTEGSPFGEHTNASPLIST